MGSGGVTLIWETLEGDGQITGYRIRRGAARDSLQVLVADTGSAATTYVDTTVTAGTRYYYTVASLNGEDQAAVTIVAPEPQGRLTASFHQVPEEHDDDTPVHLRAAAQRGGGCELCEAAGQRLHGDERPGDAGAAPQPAEQSALGDDGEADRGRGDHDRPAGGPGLRGRRGHMHGGGQAALEQPVGNSALTFQRNFRRPIPEAGAKALGHDKRVATVRFRPFSRRT